MDSTETEIAAIMAEHQCGHSTAIHVLSARAASALSPAALAKKRALEAAHDRTAKRIFDDVMTDLGCSI